MHNHQEEEEKKGPSVHKTTLKKAKSQGEKPDLKILCVTHGGLIMEFLNYVDSLKGTSGSRLNKAKNCAIFIFHIKLLSSDL